MMRSHAAATASARLTAQLRPRVFAQPERRVEVNAHGALQERRVEVGNDNPCTCCSML
ncbi:hypothetical protein [Pseudomonas antarctica]|uniref:hypothetical protein n=1 Tax=Pseudomonas antarctica TaxID=219572 RepID=UPI0019540A6D